MEFPRAAPSGIPQTSLGFRGHLIANFPHIMVLLIIKHTHLSCAALDPLCKKENKYPFLLPAYIYCVYFTNAEMIILEYYRKL